MTKQSNMARRPKTIKPTKIVHLGIKSDGPATPSSANTTTSMPRQESAMNEMHESFHQLATTVYLPDVENGVELPHNAPGVTSGPADAYQTRTSNLTLRPAAVYGASHPKAAQYQLSDLDGVPTAGENEVTLVFPNSMQAETISLQDATDLRQHSAFIDQCMSKKFFDVGGKKIYLLRITPNDFKKYTSWAQRQSLSIESLADHPTMLAGPMPMAQRKKTEELLTIDRLVHYYLIGEAMHDEKLKAESLGYLWQFSGQSYGLPLQVLEHGWATSSPGSPLRAWIFEALINTLTKELLTERAEIMPRDLVAKLFVYFVQDRAAALVQANRKAKGGGVVDSVEVKTEPEFEG